MVRRTTIRKRMRAKLREIKQQLRERMHDPVPQTGQMAQVDRARLLQLLRGTGKPQEPGSDSGIGCLRFGGALFAAGARNAGSPGRAPSLWLSDGFLNRVRSIPFLTLASPPLIRDKNRMR
jgi:hypothetical protein